MREEEYEGFCLSHGNFMQSLHWAEVKTNWLSEPVAVRDGQGRIAGCSLALVKKLPFLGTSMIYLPRGFVCDTKDRQTLGRLFDEVKGLAEEYRAFMILTDPLIDEDDSVSIRNMEELGFAYHPERRGYDTVQCRENYVLDIGGREPDEIYKSFKPKCRYNIRLAGRRGVVCSSGGEEKLDDFYRLLEVTADRDGFRVREKEYFRRLLRAFGEDAAIWLCSLDGEALSAALLVTYGGTASYVYGASSNKHRDCMPNYLMQWEMIRYAVSRGCDIYDFCGVPYWDDETHPNYGVYRFKSGFNGRVKTWAGEFEYLIPGGPGRKIAAAAYCGKSRHLR